MAHITKSYTFSAQTKAQSAQVNSDFDALYNQINSHDDQIGILSNSVFNPKDPKYGAKGDGVTDDSAAFVSLFSALNAAGSGRVEIPSGTYVIATMPNFASISNVQFVGKGNVVLKFTYSGAYAGSNIIFKQMNGVMFKFITFSAPSANLYAIFSDTTNLKSLLFEDCTIQDCSPNFMMGAANDVFFERCNFTQSASPPATLQQSIGGIQTGRFYVRRCKFNFAFSGASGTLISVATNSAVLAGYHAIIESCEFMTDNLTGYTMDAAIDVEPSGTTPIESVTIRNCKFYNCRTYLTGANYIDVDGCYYRWTSVGQAQGNAVQLNVYNSSGTSPTTGTLRIRNTDVVQDANAASTYQTQICKIQRSCNRILIEYCYFLMNGSGTSGLNPLFEYVGGTCDHLIIDHCEFDVNVNVGAVSTLLFDFSTVNHIEFTNCKVNRQWQHLFSFGVATPSTIQTFVVRNSDLSNFSCSTGTVFAAWLWINGTNTTFTNPRYENNIGLNPGGNVSPAVPASGSAYTNNLGYPVVVSVSGGTVTQIAIGGTNTGLTSGSFYLPTGVTITLTYSVAPTWLWFGL